MPGVRRDADRERIEAGWFRQGFEDGAAGRAERGPDRWDGASAGLDTLGSYRRGYASGREQYLGEQRRPS